MNAQAALQPNPLTVVKLGGSYARSPHLAAAVSAIGRASQAIVIVPGGGPFADAVRELQARMRYDDRTAHRMAILAMCQFAESIASLHPRLRIANSLAAIRTVLAEGSHAVWSPWPLADGLEAMPPSWDITSDSLSVWLAGKLGANRLVLLKSANPPAQEITPSEAVTAGAVDAQFPGFLREAGAGVQAWWFTPAQLGQLTAFLNCEGESGARIVWTKGTSTVSYEDIKT